MFYVSLATSSKQLKSNQKLYDLNMCPHYYYASCTIRICIAKKVDVTYTLLIAYC